MCEVQSCGLNKQGCSTGEWATAGRTHKGCWASKKLSDRAKGWAPKAGATLKHSAGGGIRVKERR